MKVKMSITQRFKDPLTRQANEAVRITNRNKIELLNSKNEFNHPPIARITVEKKNIFKKSIQNIVSESNQYANQTMAAHSSSHSGKEPISNDQSAVNTSSNNSAVSRRTTSKVLC